MHGRSFIPVEEDLLACENGFLDFFDKCSRHASKVIMNFGGNSSEQENGLVLSYLPQTIAEDAMQWAVYRTQFHPSVRRALREILILPRRDQWINHRHHHAAHSHHSVTPSLCFLEFHLLIERELSIEGTAFRGYEIILCHTLGRDRIETLWS